MTEEVKIKTKKTGIRKAKPAEKKAAEKPAAKKEHYFAALGGRKTALAQARIYTKPGSILINDRDYKDYFSNPENQSKVIAPFELMKIADKLSASVKVQSGGINAQAEAARNAIAKALVKFNADFKKRLRKAGYITRDARMVERKKYGLKKARRAPQWAKR